MKLLTIAVPSYNSQDYLKNCIDSLLVGGERVEIIIIDDGSTDNTGKIADQYQKDYPTIVKVIHQPNGGHGEGVNQGLLHSTGLYYKVVDSDDLLEKDGYLALLDTIEKRLERHNLPDLFICNFIYEHIYDDGKYVSEYTRFMLPNKIITWDYIKGFPLHHMLLMHALVYRKDTLVESNTVLPKHCFYVDNYFSYKPLAFCETLYYLPVNLYRYRIGRPDQSVTTTNMFKRYTQQVTVMNLMLNAFKYDEIKKMPKGLKKYLIHDLGNLNLVTLFFITGGKDNKKVRKQAFHEYWDALKVSDKKMYLYLRHRSYYGLIFWMPYQLKKFIIRIGYNLTAKVAKLG